MRKEAIIALAVLVRQNSCGDDDRNWTAEWTMPDGSVVHENIVDPISDRPVLSGATSVEVKCPTCHRTWKVSDVGDSIISEVGIEVTP